MPELLYLDASACVKLVLAEPESRVLGAALEEVERLVASEILEVEVVRATQRGGGDVAVARAQLEGVRLLPLSAEIRRRASTLSPLSTRSLDAIHMPPRWSWASVSMVCAPTTSAWPRPRAKQGSKCGRLLRQLVGRSLRPTQKLGV